jgi:hypothetical protein
MTDDGDFGFQGPGIVYEDDDMCPNCVTPWKCNGPHLSGKFPPDYPYPEPQGDIKRVCIDLDGTLAWSVWPQPHVGVLMPEGADIVKHYFEAGYEIIVFTARPESHRARIERWLEENGLGHYIYEVRCGKPVSGLYIDDRSWNPWE